MDQNNKSKVLDFERINNDVLENLSKKEEPRFLSILLRDKDCLMDAMSFGISFSDNGHFWCAKPRFLYKIIYEYYRKYSEILTRTAMESVMDSLVGSIIDEEEKTSARMYYDEVYSIDVPIEDYEMLRDRINDRYLQCQAFSIMKSNMASLVKSTNNQSLIIKKIREDFINIDNLESDSYCGSFSIVDSMSKVRDYITDRRENPHKIIRIPTYIDALDKIYHLNPGSYTIISGMINGGKTTLMFNIGFNMAKAGHNVVYVSIEKEAFPIMLRLTSLHALVDYNRIKNGGNGEYGLNDFYYDKLMLASRDLEDNIRPNLDIIQAVVGTKLSKIISEIEKIKAKKKIDVIIVDYLGVIGFETNHPGRPDLDEAIVSKRLQAYGKKNQFVTIAASQLKTTSAKDIRNKSKKASVEDPSHIEVNTEDLAGSKMIIADADNGLSAILNSESPPNKMFVYGTKARDDESRSCVVLDFDGKIGRISDPEFSSDHILEVDSLLYNEQITEEDLSDNKILFSDTKINLDQFQDNKYEDLIFSEFEEVNNANLNDDSDDEILQLV